jgi:hypothetical protein
LKAPTEIINVWKRFNHYPMDTLTKAWYFEKNTIKKQREVSLMKEHYEEFGITGNCFDLSLWLIHEFNKENIEAYPIGTQIHTTDAHVAVIALDNNGKRYLCDLGDQWIQPILIEENYNLTSEQKLSGFFPGAEVTVKTSNNVANAHYFRPNGKVSKQTYSLNPIEMGEFLIAAETSQNHVKKEPLLESRLFEGAEVAHWEFYNWESWRSSSLGILKDDQLQTIEEWSERIHNYTGYDVQFLNQALQLYWNKSKTAI